MDPLKHCSWAGPPLAQTTQVFYLAHIVLSVSIKDLPSWHLVQLRHKFCKPGWAWPDPTTHELL